MEKEYCVIYGGTDKYPDPFIIAVSDNQEMINGFREEHYHFCVHGEVVRGYDYDKLAPDFEISYNSGHYVTPIMITEFINYLNAIFNQTCMILDNIERDVEQLIFDDYESNIMDEGLDLLRDHLTGMSYTMNIEVPYSMNVIDETVYGNVLNVPKCLDDFMNTYEPNNEVFNNYL